MENILCTYLNWLSPLSVDEWWQWRLELSLSYCTTSYSTFTWLVSLVLSEQTCNKSRSTQQVTENHSGPQISMPTFICANLHAAIHGIIWQACTLYVIVLLLHHCCDLAMCHSYDIIKQNFLVTHLSYSFERRLRCIVLRSKKLCIRCCNLIGQKGPQQWQTIIVHLSMNWYADCGAISNVLSQTRHSVWYKTDNSYAAQNTSSLPSYPAYSTKHSPLFMSEASTSRPRRVMVRASGMSSGSGTGMQRRFLCLLSALLISM